MSTDIYMTPLKPENKREMYFGAREQSQRLQRATLHSIGPVRAWGGYLLNALGWSGVIVLLAVWLLGRW